MLLSHAPGRHADQEGAEKREKQESAHVARELAKQSGHEN
jgi:hypothetical protein